MLLTIDVGNTNTVFGIYRGEKLLGSFRLSTTADRTSDELGMQILQYYSFRGLKPSETDAVIIASVVPPIMHTLVNAIRKYIGVMPLVVGKDVDTGLENRYDNPKEVGIDRLVNAVSAVKKSTRMKPIEIIRGLEAGARNVLGVAIACAAAGIIIGVVTKTGVGLKLASGLLALSGGYLLPTMFFTMITSLILGMGVPTTANYVITSTIAAPALLQMGVPVLAAHMFVFYFGIIADVTPPVALAAYAASGISGGKPLITGVNASKLAIAAFIIPYIFVLSPEILMINATVFSLIFAAVTAILGMVGVSSAMIGYLVDHSSPVERVLQFVGGILMIMPGVWTDIPGFIIFVLVVMWQSRRKKKHRTA